MAILITGSRVLAKENIKVVEQNDAGKYWVEELKGEIIDFSQGSNIKDDIKTEREKRSKFFILSLTIMQHVCHKMSNYPVSYTHLTLPTSYPV